MLSLQTKELEKPPAPDGVLKSEKNYKDQKQPEQNWEQDEIKTIELDTIEDFKKFYDTIKQDPEYEKYPMLFEDLKDFESKLSGLIVIDDE